MPSARRHSEDFSYNSVLPHPNLGFISSYPFASDENGKLSEQVIRGIEKCANQHWQVEVTHWHLDVNFGQDFIQCKHLEYLIGTLAIMKNSYNLLKMFQLAKQQALGLTKPRSIARIQKDLSKDLPTFLKSFEMLDPAVARKIIGSNI